MEINTNISPEILSAKQNYSIVGNSPDLIAAIGRALQSAKTDLSVLIIGESGSGKEFFPKIIHNNSARKHSNKYIAVNCGAIPEGTIDSELFGHEKGAFTGAISDRKGYFEEANGGTIFLDEVAELPLTTQARLLRVLESGEYIRVGSSEVKKTNIRVVAATNKNMLQAVNEGKFRADLYYRLSTILITIPPLRERGNDILLLTHKFATEFAERYRTTPVKFDDSAKSVLLSYRWPGNVRQLKNVIEQIALFEAGSTVYGEEIKKKYLPQYSTEYKPTVASTPAFDYTREREILFKLIFKMQSEIDELREELRSGAVHRTDAEHHYQPGDKYALSREVRKVEQHHGSDDADGDNKIVKFPRLKSPAFEAHDVAAETIEAETAEEVEPMTLEATERETIKSSLERNGGKRKTTARELNISERTLYRKIKEYGLE